MSGLPHDQNGAPSPCTRRIVGASSDKNLWEREDEGSFRCWAEDKISRTALPAGDLELSKGVIAALEFGYQRVGNMIIADDFRGGDGREYGNKE